jgi:hypothetical protein
MVRRNKIDGVGHHDSLEGYPKPFFGADTETVKISVVHATHFVGFTSEVPNSRRVDNKTDNT